MKKLIICSFLLFFGLALSQNDKVEQNITPIELPYNYSEVRIGKLSEIIEKFNANDAIEFQKYNTGKENKKDVERYKATATYENFLYSSLKEFLSYYQKASDIESVNEISVALNNFRPYPVISQTSDYQNEVPKSEENINLLSNYFGVIKSEIERIKNNRNKILWGDFWSDKVSDYKYNETTKKLELINTIGGVNKLQLQDYGLYFKRSDRAEIGGVMINEVKIGENNILLLSTSYNQVVSIDPNKKSVDFLGGYDEVKKIFTKLNRYENVTIIKNIDKGDKNKENNINDKTTKPKGATESFSEYLRRRILELVDMNKINGNEGIMRAEIVFTVKTNKEIANIKVEGGTPEFRAEILKAMNALKPELDNKLTPAKMNGKEINSQYRLPISINFE